MTQLERALEGDLQGFWIGPESHSRIGLLVLGGSSGTVPIERARLLAALGLQVVALRWFGGPGQSPGICEIALETFVGAVDFLERAGCERIGVLGTSKGAEAALLLGTVEPRVQLIVALSPTSVVWANVGPGHDGFEWPQRSSFTWRGEPFAFVPHRAEALLAINRLPPTRYLELFNSSLEAFPDETAAAAIFLEGSGAQVILAAGGDDHLWPSARFARALAQRLDDHGRSATLIIDPDAGHRPLLPGETSSPSRINDHGGSKDADRAAGNKVAAEVLRWAGAASRFRLGRGRARELSRLCPVTL